jgi:hypothetical protein
MSAPLKLPRATGCLLLKKRGCLILELSEYQQKKVSGLLLSGAEALPTI